MDKLTQEVRKVLQSVALHGYDLICAEHDILKAMQTDHEAKLKEELIKYDIHIYNHIHTEETSKKFVDEYLKTRNNG